MNMDIFKWTFEETKEEEEEEEQVEEETRGDDDDDDDEEEEEEEKERWWKEEDKGRSTIGGNASGFTKGASYSLVEGEKIEEEKENDSTLCLEEDSVLVFADVRMWLIKNRGS
ncbi:hypothetical protein HZH68_003432 [Vespula germanica]|uniref:Uncharacterized protein n=1 Tax=Vespula germanica TaxID=30212 RepID=A0A834U3C0_VESGE|nr:hypothetical protein HZH68_003432 [Vespula germanica]